jgi:hydroxymethylbilane synthase
MSQHGTLPPLRIGTRGSELARRQATIVGEALQEARPGTSFEVSIIRTEGDTRPDLELSHFEGQGVFVRRIEAALLAGEIDVAVHSFKDMPSAPTDGLVVAAFLAREDARDALVSRSRMSLGALPPGSTVGTGSPRRQALLRDVRPDLDIRGVRGNVDTRLRRVSETELDAVVLASAGLSRLGRTDEIAELLDPERFTPAVGQGVLAVQIRADDERIAEIVRPLDDPMTRACALAERAVAVAVAAGCQTPLGAYAQVVDGVLRVSACLSAGPEGPLVRAEDQGSPWEAESVGTRVGQELLRAQRPGRAPEPDGPLFGRRILVTRPAGQAARLVDALRAEGAEAIEVPVIGIEPPPSYEHMDAAIRRRDYDWAVFTSANGVRFFYERLLMLGESAAWFEGMRVAAIGPETARTLRASGVATDLVPDEYVAEALVACLADAAPLRGQRILLPRADIARDALATGLLCEGAAVDSVVAYRTVSAPAAPTVRAEIEAGVVDAVTFTSSSTVRAFLDMIAGQTGLLNGVALACIGPITAQTLRDAGLEPSVVAETYTVPGLVTAIRDYYLRATAGGRSAAV